MKNENSAQEADFNAQAMRDLQASQKQSKDTERLLFVSIILLPILAGLFLWASSDRIFYGALVIIVMYGLITTFLKNRKSRIEEGLYLKELEPKVSLGQDITTTAGDTTEFPKANE